MNGMTQAPSYNGPVQAQAPQSVSIFDTVQQQLDMILGRLNGHVAALREHLDQIAGPSPNQSGPGSSPSSAKGPRAAELLARLVQIGLLLDEADRQANRVRGI